MGEPPPEKDLYTTTEAADRLRIPAVLLRFLLLYPGFERSRCGQAKVIRGETVAEIDRFLTGVDPEGHHRSPSGARHRGRPNQPAPSEQSKYTTPRGAR